MNGLEFLFRWVTLPGVLFRGAADFFLCHACEIEVAKVDWFRGGVPVGRADHADSPTINRLLALRGGAVLASTLAAIALGSGALVLQQTLPGWSLVPRWFAVSVGSHAFPMIEDVVELTERLKGNAATWPQKAVGYPLVGALWIGAEGRRHWFDLVYGCFVGVIVPLLLPIA